MGRQGDDDARASARGEASEARCVLVVEDHADTRHMLGILLELDGHVCVLAPDAPAAIELARSRDVQVALIDIGLPGMSGHDLARELRTAFGAGVRLIATTGDHGADAHALAAAFDAVLFKPVDPDVLLREVGAAPGAAG